MKLNLAVAGKKRSLMKASACLVVGLTALTHANSAMAAPAVARALPATDCNAGSTPAPSRTSSTIVMCGDNDIKVTRVEGMLVGLGMLSDSARGGAYDYMTRNAIGRFQQLNGLPIEGRELNQATYEAMLVPWNRMGRPVPWSKVPSVRDQAAQDAFVGKVEGLVVQKSNEFRRQNGLGTLRVDKKSTNIARQWSFTMSYRDAIGVANAYAHNPNRTAQLGAVPNAENLIVWSQNGSPSAEEAAQKIFDGWRNSTGHRENLLNRDVNRFGVGIWVDDNGTFWATQVFAG